MTTVAIMDCGCSYEEESGEGLHQCETCRKRWEVRQKEQAEASSLSGWLARLDRCEEELHEMLETALKDNDNSLLADNLDNALTYVSIAKGYLPA